MELTQTENAPSFRFYKIAGSIAVPLLGIGLLLILALQFSRSAEGLDRLCLGSVALGAGVIGVSYYRQRRMLSKLVERIDDKALSGLCHTANAMAVFGFMICLTVLVFFGHGHH